MRLRFELDGSVKLGVHDPGGQARRSMLAVPQEVSLVSDLVHHLRCKFQLPQQHLVLSVGSFSLLPAFRIDAVLRDGDALVARAGGETNAKRRAPGGMLALAMVPWGEAPTAQASPSAGAKRPRLGSGAAAALALPAPSPPSPRPPPACGGGKGRGTPPAAGVAARALAALPDAAAASEAAPRPYSGGRSAACAPSLAHGDAAPVSEAQAAAAYAGALALAARNVLAAQEASPALAAAAAAPVAGVAGASPPPASCSGPPPNAAAVELWRPIARAPASGEFVRFRTRGRGGLSDFRVAFCVAREEDPAQGGLVLTLRGLAAEGKGAKSAEERVAFAELLQVSVPKVGRPAKGPRPAAAGTAPAPTLAAGSPEESAPQAGTPPKGLRAAVAGVAPAAMPAASSAAPREPTDSPQDAELKKLTGGGAGARWRPKCSSVGAEALLLEKRLSAAALGHDRVAEAVRGQFEFYLGPDNYPKDGFLQSQAYSGGWISLRLMAKFNRVRELTDDLAVVRGSVASSAEVEVSECGEYVRRRHPV